MGELWRCALVYDDRSPLPTTVHILHLLKKKQMANWPLTCRRNYKIKMIKQMQMVRHKLNSYILYVSENN